jgi:hypothetical protein
VGFLHMVTEANVERKSVWDISLSQLVCFFDIAWGILVWGGGGWEFGVRTEWWVRYSENLEGFHYF